LIAAALTPIACWVATEILLVVLEPWLTALAGQRQAGQLDPDAARAVTAVVSVFAVAQASLVLSGGVIAGGLELGSARRRAGTRERSGGARPQVVAAPSRAQGLAQRLQAGTPAEGAVSRITVAGARGPDAGRPDPREPSAARPARLGDTYRRDRLRPRAAPRRDSGA
ncbi:MAG TPA: hypothetical protein VFW47_13040, partial [Phenylobacterium sp.]|nr:hypothetical protein [Phenylobacterium sp.]